MKKPTENKPACTGETPFVEQTASGGNLIRLSDCYEGYEGSTESVEVSDEVLAFLRESKQEEKRYEMRDYRHRVPFAFHEQETAAIEGIYEPPADETYFQNVELDALYHAIRSLSPIQQRRCVMYFFERYSVKSISEFEDVSPTAIRQSIDGALVALRRLLSDFDD